MSCPACRRLAGKSGPELASWLLAGLDDRTRLTAWVEAEFRQAHHEGQKLTPCEAPSGSQRGRPQFAPLGLTQGQRSTRIPNLLIRSSGRRGPRTSSVGHLGRSQGQLRPRTSARIRLGPPAWLHRWL